MAFIPTQYNNPVFVYSLRKLVTDYYDPLVRVIRESDFVEVDVLPDSNDEISYDSVIARTSQTAATTLGEFLNIDGYADVDSLGSVYEGRLVKVYDQSAGTFDIEIASYGDAFLFVETNLAEYSGSTAIHKVNGIPTFRPQQLTTAFQVSNVRGREVSYHFLVEGTQSGFFGIVDSSNTLAIQGLHNYTLERTYTSFISPSTPSDWDVNDVYFDSVVSTNITGSLYESNTWNNFDTAIITVEAAIKDNAVTQSAFPDNTATFRLVQNNWYCDFIAFDDYDPVRRLTIEGLYADASSNTSAIARTSKLLINNEDPNQSGFLVQFPNAAAAYSVRSLRGLTGVNGPKVLRVRREVDNAEVDVYTDSTGWVSLDSPVVIVPAITGQIDGGTGVEIESLANTLGEFVADADHDDVDSLGSPTTAKVVVWYDQSSADYTIISEEIDARGAPVRIRVVGGTYDAYEFDLYFDDNESISLSSYVADTYEISDGATQVTANLTLGTLQTLVDAGMIEATVCVWYDQSGNGNDATQTQTLAQPTIFTGGAVVIENGEPAVQFDGIDDEFALSLSGLNINNLSVSTVCKSDVTTGNRMQFTLNTGSNQRYWHYMASGPDTMWYGGTTQISHGAMTTDQRLRTFIAGSTSGAARSFLNGTEASTSNSLVSGTISANEQFLGNYHTGSFYWDGTMQEFLVWGADQYSNRTGIEATINNYYDIYGTGNTGGNIKTLDVFPDAAAAYSLRKLRTSYNGPVNLSKRKDAIQNVATAQPTIYNNGLIIENGRGAVEFDGSTDYLQTSYSTANNYTAFWVQTPVDGVASVLVGRGDLASRHVFGWASANKAFFYRDGSTGIQATGAASQYVGYVLNKPLSSDCRIGYNGSLGITSATIGTGTLENMVLGAERSSFTQYGQSKAQEIIIYEGDQSGNRTDIENNINSAFQIYAANFSSVLDTVPLAKAAYSIRRLTKNYIGPIITVTNGSTTKDFYADFWGNLDVDALTSFANGGTLSVTKWWDQSGKNNHLESTANHPTLNISNGVVTGVTVNSTNGFDVAQIITDMNAVTTGSKQLIAVTSTIDDTIDLNTTSYTDLKEIIYYT